MSRCEACKNDNIHTLGVKGVKGVKLITFLPRKKWGVNTPFPRGMFHTLTQAVQHGMQAYSYRLPASQALLHKPGRFIGVQP